jgi:hypothetical protein
MENQYWAGSSSRRTNGLLPSPTLSFWRPLNAWPVHSPQFGQQDDCQCDAENEPEDHFSHAFLAGFRYRTQR